MVFTLDPVTALPNLILSESRKHIYSKESVSQNGDAPTHQEQGESEAIFSVLGKIFLTVERQYWEVEVNIGQKLDLELDGLWVFAQTQQRERGGF